MLRYVIVTAEVMLLIVFIVPLFHGIFNVGNGAGIALCLILVLLTIYFGKFSAFLSRLWDKPLGKALMLFVGLVLAGSVLLCMMFSFFMASAQSRAPDNEVKAMIVLGCKVNGSKPSRMLTRRLESAGEYLDQHPDVLCVVSGGQGDDENVSEAQAMKTYLMEKGIQPDRIIMENKSTNTEENMKFSSEILDEHDINKVAIVTDGFHQYRAKLIAEKYHLDTYAVNAGTDYLTKWLIPTYWVREWFAIVGEYLK